MGRNTYNLPQGEPIAAELRVWLRRQLAEVLGTVPEIGAPLPPALPALTHWDQPMADAMTPIISAYWDEAGKQERAKLGLDPDAWQVRDPHLAQAIERASLDFCRSTNQTTSRQLEDALAALRAELAAGLVERGETIPQLTRRVQAVFERAETWRAQRIAATEASRAVHEAEYQSATESGVVAGFEWLLSEDACPLCQRVAAEAPRVPAGQAFAVVGDHPVYATVRHPPLHPACQCSMREILLPAYGGPDQVDWSATLQQPQHD